MNKNFYEISNNLQNMVEALTSEAHNMSDTCDNMQHTLLYDNESLTDEEFDALYSKSRANDIDLEILESRVIKNLQKAIDALNEIV